MKYIKKQPVIITPYERLLQKLSHPILPDIICNAVAEEVSYSLEKAIETDRIKKYLLERFKNEYNTSASFRDASRQANAVRNVRKKLFGWCEVYGEHKNLDEIMNGYTMRNEIEEEILTEK